jgi:hypothetical protein
MCVYLKKKLIHFLFLFSSFFFFGMDIEICLIIAYLSSAVSVI